MIAPLLVAERIQRGEEERLRIDKQGAMSVVVVVAVV